MSQTDVPQIVFHNPKLHFSCVINQMEFSQILKFLTLTFLSVWWGLRWLWPRCISNYREGWKNLRLQDFRDSWSRPCNFSFRRGAGEKTMQQLRETPGAQCNCEEFRDWVIHRPQGGLSTSGGWLLQIQTGEISPGNKEKSLPWNISGLFIACFCFFNIFTFFQSLLVLR